MKIAICDDEKIMRAEIFKHIQKSPHAIDFSVDFFENGKLLLASLPAQNYDLIFLDIEMPGMTGLEVAREIRNSGHSTLLAFITSHEELALEGYEVSAVRFLRKPLETEKLLDCLAYAFKKTQLQEKIVCATESGEVFIKLADIDFLEVQNKTVLVTMSDKNLIEVREKLSTFEEKLQTQQFYRCHRSYLVNLNAVKNLGKNELTVRSGAMVPVSRSSRKALHEALLQVLTQQTGGG